MNLYQQDEEAQFCPEPGNVPKDQILFYRLKEMFPETEEVTIYNASQMDCLNSATEFILEKGKYSKMLNSFVS